MGIWPLCILLFVIISFKNETHSLSGVEVPKDSNQNVGTVLFDKYNLNDHCWTNEEFVVLSSRKKFQDLLPRIDALNIHDDEYIAGLLDYFYICLQKINDSVMGKTKHLMLKAMVDLMGGYLYSYLAPIIKVSYYAGKVRFHNAEKIFLLLEEIKIFLRTDGLGWKKPIELEMFINVTPIAVTAQEESNPCDKLIVKYPKTLSKEKNRSRRDYLSNNDSDYEDHFPLNEETVEGRTSSILFLPYFDNNAQPNSIALPFKDRTLWSLYDEASIDLLDKYYETSVNCISTMENHEKVLEEFNNDFYKWLIRTVYPHLSDDKWYPAFGGVLRIIVFLKRKVKIENDPTDVKPVLKLDQEEKKMSTIHLIIVAVVTAIVVWLIAGACLTCYKFIFGRTEESCSSSETSNSNLNSNSNSDSDDSTYCSKTVYCTDSTCQCKETRQSFSGMMKSWCIGKFKSDPVTLRERGGRCAESDSHKQFLMESGSRRFNKRRKKKLKSRSDTPSSSNSTPRTHYINKKFHYSSDLSSTSSDNSNR